MMKIKMSKEKVRADRTLSSEEKTLRKLEDIMMTARKAGYSLFM